MSKLMSCIRSLLSETLHSAVANGDFKKVEALLKSGVQDFKAIKHSEFEGYAGLHLAAERDFLDIMTLLLNANSDVNAEDPRGFTALHIAASKGYVGCVIKLLEYNAGIDTRTKKERRTALHMAAYDGRIEVVTELIKRNASINPRDKWRFTPSDLAEIFEYDEIVQIIRDACSWKC